MRRSLATIAVVTSLAAVTVPLATAASDGDPAAGPSTTDVKPTVAGPSSVDPSTFDPDGLVDAAKAGYAEFVASFADGDSGQDVADLAECPWIAPADLVAAVSKFGDAAHLESEIRSTLEVEEGEDGTANSVIITCDTEDYTEDNDEATGPVYGVGIGVFDYSATPESLELLADFVVSEGAGVVVEPSADTLGGTLYGYCEEDDDLPVGSVGCFQFWISGQFAVGMYVVSDGSGEDTLELLEQVLLDQLPILLQRIADGIAPVETVDVIDSVDIAIDVTVTVGR